MVKYYEVSPTQFVGGGGLAEGLPGASTAGGQGVKTTAAPSTTTGSELPRASDVRDGARQSAPRAPTTEARIQPSSKVFNPEPLAAALLAATALSAVSVMPQVTEASAKLAEKVSNLQIKLDLDRVPETSEVVSALSSALQSLMKIGGELGAQFNGLMHHLGLDKLLGGESKLKDGELHKLLKSALGKLNDSWALSLIGDLTGIKTLLEGACSFIEAKDPKDRLVALGVFVFGLVQVGSIGFGAFKACKMGETLTMKALGNSVGDDAVNALEGGIKEAIEQFGSKTLSRGDASKILGNYADNLDDLSVKSIGECLAQKNADELAEYALKQYGTLDPSNLSKGQLDDLKTLAGQRLKDSYTTLFKKAGLDQVAKEATAKWLQKHPQVISKIESGALSEKELVELMTKRYLEEMGGLKKGWFEVYAKQLGKFGNGGDGLAIELEDTFYKAIDDAARPFIEKGIKEAIQEAKDKGRRANDGASRPATISGVDNHQLDELREMLVFKSDLASARGEPPVKKGKELFVEVRTAERQHGLVAKLGDYRDSSGGSQGIQLGTTLGEGAKTKAA